MNENIHNNEITFQSIYALVKRSFVRIVVFAIIAAVIVGAIGAMGILISTNDPLYQAIIEFNYEGAEEGLDPWGRKP